MSSGSGKQLAVWVLSDGRAGHVNQSKGVLAALRMWTEVREHVIDVRVRVGFFRNLMGGLLRTGARNLALLKVFCRFDRLPQDTPDLIVSAGGNTRHANAWLARAMGCKNLFCGDLRGMSRRMFTGVITSDESHEGQQGWIVSPTPVSITPQGVDEAAKQWREAAHAANGHLWTLLVGGTGAGYHWKTSDIRAMVETIKGLHQSVGARWVVVTSRRTGKETEDLLRQALDDSVVAGWCVPNDPKAIPYQAALGAAERIIVTEDSHMMITEAIASGRPVHTVRPETCDPDESNLLFLKLYEGQGWISRHDLFLDGGLPELKGLEKATVDRLGKQLQEWWKGGNGGPA